MNRIIASRLDSLPDGRLLPPAEAWDTAEPIAYCADWRGECPDPGRETRVRLLWSPESLYLHFHCRYREIYAYDGGNSRRNGLWQRDVAEVFIRPPENELRHYLEFEVSPNGDWLDLDIAPGKKTILYCDIKSRVLIDSSAGVWTAEIAIPMQCLTATFNPADVWHINFFRIEGSEPNRFYSAWQPTHAPQPNFHVPEVFRPLQFSM